MTEAEPSPGSPRRRASGGEAEMVEGFHPPRQDRSRRTLDRLLQATENLLREKDFREISVDEIVDRAGSSKGAFYTRFDHKDALLAVLRSERFDAALEEWTGFLDPDRWEEAPLAEFFAALSERLIRIYSRRAALMREFVSRSRRDPEVRRKARSLNQHVLDGAVRVVRHHPDSVDHPDVDRAVRLGIVAAGAVARERLLFDASATDGIELSECELERELSRLLTRYLGLT